MSNAITQRQNGAIASEDQRQMLRDLVMKGASEQQVELVMHVCNRYGFDPLLKHVVLISGGLYVTRDGLLDNAHRSGKFDGIEVRAEQLDGGKWLATATVWVKDMGHPVTYSAYQSEHENAQSPAWKKAPRAMTVKCAEVMALKRAFNVSLGTAEEMGHDDTPMQRQPIRPSTSPEPVEVIDSDTGEIIDAPMQVNDPSAGHPATERQIKAIFGIGRSKGLTNDQITEEIYGRFGVQSRKDLTVGQASELIDAFSAIDADSDMQPALGM